jgi:hypothetical protein
MKSLGQKENQIDEEMVIFLQLWMLLRDEGDWKLINFQLLVLFYLFRNWGGVLQVLN